MSYITIIIYLLFCLPKVNIIFPCLLTKGLNYAKLISVTEHFEKFLYRIIADANKMNSQTIDPLSENIVVQDRSHGTYCSCNLP